MTGFMNLFAVLRRSALKLPAVPLLRLLLAASLICPAIVLAVFARVTYEDAYRDARLELKRTSDVAREHSSKVFDSFRLIANQIKDILEALSTAEIRSREYELYIRFGKLIQGLPQAESIVVVGADGRPLVATGEFPIVPFADFSDRDYFINLKKNPSENYISQVQNSRITGQRFFGWGRAFEKADGSFQGAIDIAISPQFFLQFYSTLTGAAGNEIGGRVVSMIRDDGQILVRYPPIDGIAPKVDPANPFFVAIREMPEKGSYTNRSIIDSGAPKRLFAFAKVPGQPVYVVAGRSIDAIEDGWRQRMYRYLAFGLPATAALFLLTFATLQGAKRQRSALIKMGEEMRRREALEDQVRQLQKIEAVGQLTGGIAHDFNNMLAIVIGSLDMIKRRLTGQEHPKLATYVERATDGARRAATLTNRLLAFSRQSPLEPKVLDVNKLVSGMSELLLRTIGEWIKIETVLSGGLWKTRADPTQVESALVNLAVNARDAMPEGGKLTIETLNAHLDDGYARENSDVKAGQYVVMSVTDTGHGMTADIISRAFDPFFTTKGVGKGTGLGLSQVFGFVKQSGGHIKIYSEIGHGTTVKIYLPRYTGADAETGNTKTMDVPLPTGRAEEIVMVVEDEESVREVTVDSLRELGYTVLQAESPIRALELLQEQPEINLLFTDIVMPQMNGRQLADEAVRRFPNLKVLYTTGYARNAIIHNGTLDNDTAFLAKPFTTAQLAQKIREVLSE